MDAPHYFTIRYKNRSIRVMTDEALTKENRDAHTKELLEFVRSIEEAEPIKEKQRGNKIK